MIERFAELGGDFHHFVDGLADGSRFGGLKGARGQWWALRLGFASDRGLRFAAFTLVAGRLIVMHVGGRGEERVIVGLGPLFGPLVSGIHRLRLAGRIAPRLIIGVRVVVMRLLLGVFRIAAGRRRVGGVRSGGGKGLVAAGAAASASAAAATSATGTAGARWVGAGGSGAWFRRVS